MELADRLKQLSKEMGVTLSDEEIADHVEFCTRIDEHILLGEADRIAEELTASVACMLAINQYAASAKRSCALLRALVIGRCAQKNPALAAEVERMLKETAEVLSTSPLDGLSFGEGKLN